MLELLENLQSENPLYGGEWVVTPYKIVFDLLKHLEGESAILFRQLIAAQPDRVFEATKSEALSLIEEYSDNDCGFGSSDMIGVMMRTLNTAGCKTTFAHGVGITIEEITIPY